MSHEYKTTGRISEMMNPHFVAFSSPRARWMALNRFFVAVAVAQILRGTGV